MERQERNIKKEYPDAFIVKEVFTGTKFQGRKELEKIINMVVEGDVIIFDSVSRMSRSAEEGFAMYQDLYEKGIELVFLKEPHISTAVFRKALQVEIQLTGTKADIILEAVKEYLMEVAKEQILIAFQQAEKEVKDLQQRTKEGLMTKKLNGQKLGHEKGTKLVTKKSVWAKEQIRKYSKDFGGSLNDAECIRMIGIARGTFYKYKREIEEEVVY